MLVNCDVAPYRLGNGNKLLQNRGEQVPNRNRAVSLINDPCVKLPRCRFVGRGVRYGVGKPTLALVTGSVARVHAFVMQAKYKLTCQHR